MKLLLSVGLLLLCCPPAWAALFICGDPTTFRGHGFFDPSQPPTCPAPSALSQVPKAQTDAQVALIEAFPKYYLKVVGTAPGGLVTEKTPAEKAEADAAILAKQQEQQAKEDEQAQNDFCNSTDWTQIATKIETMKTNIQADITSLDGLEPVINGIASMADAKTVMVQMNNAYQSVMTSMNNKYMNGFEKIARCEFAKRP